MAHVHTERELYAYWLGALAVRAEGENALRAAARSAFRRIRARLRDAALVEALTLNAGVVPPLEVADWARIVAGDLRPGSLASIRRGWARAFELIPGVEATAFDASDPRIVTLLARVLATSREIAETTAREVAEAYAPILAAGGTVDDLAAAVDMVMDSADSVRARTIARTASTATVEGGQRIGYEVAGVPAKRWLSERDDLVREAHIAADGQTVPVADAFDVDGESLEYPGDPAGSAGNVINCRCTTLPVLP